ncbi:MAG: hypothetical protein ACE5H9_09715 [Anaerolineae bacterium]
MSSQSISFRPVALIRQMPWSVDGKAALGLLLIIVTVSLVGWLYLSQASYLTATSYRVEELRIKLETVQQANAALELEIAQLESLSRIEQRALELGFRPPDEVRYLAVANYPDAETGAQHNVEPQPEDPVTSWWQNVLVQFGAWLEGETS